MDKTWEEFAKSGKIDAYLRYKSQKKSKDAPEVSNEIHDSLLDNQRKAHRGK